MSLTYLRDSKTKGGASAMAHRLRKKTPEANYLFVGCGVYKQEMALGQKNLTALIASESLTLRDIRRLERLYASVLRYMCARLLDSRWQSFQAISSFSPAGLTCNRLTNIYSERFGVRFGYYDGWLYASKGQPLEGDRGRRFALRESELGV